jgi:hypothetical protein
MGGNRVGLDSGGGSRGASFGGLGMRAIFSLFGVLHHKPDAQPRPRGGFGIVRRRKGAQQLKGRVHPVEQGNTDDAEQQDGKGEGQEPAC